MCNGKCKGSCNSAGAKSLNNINEILNIQYNIALLRMKNYIEGERFIELAAKKQSLWLFPLRRYYNRKIKEVKENMQFFNKEISREAGNLKRLTDGEDKS